MINYRFFLRNKKFNYIALSYIGIVYFFHFFIANTFKEVEVYYYFFSSVVQGFIALAALLVTVAVYRLQLYENQLTIVSSELQNILEPYSVYNTAFDLKRHLAEGDNEYVASEIAKPNSLFNGNDTKKASKIKARIIGINSSRRQIRFGLFNFSSLSFFEIGVSLIGIILAPILKDHQLFGFIYLVIALALSFFCLFLAWLLVESILGPQFDIENN